MSVRVLVGHVLDRLADLPDESVHCVVTSPPYYGLRSYGTAPQVWPDGWRGDLGLEPTPELFIQHLVEVFREVRRVLRRDGTLWLNIGDSYATSNPAGRRDSGEGTSAKFGEHKIAGSFGSSTRRNAGCKSKDLLMIPAQLALALRADGWWLRSEIVWAKRAPMPESCTDRPTCAHEKIFLLSKSKTYMYDAEAVKEESVEDTHGDAAKRGEFSGKTEAMPGRNSFRAITTTRNLRNVWHLGPEPFSEWGETVRQVRVAWDAPVDGKKRKASPDCPLHGDRPGPAPNGRDDGHASGSASHSARNDNRPAPGQPSDCVPIDLHRARVIEQQSSDLPLLSCSPSATPHSMESHRTALVPETISACSASAQTDSHIADTSASRGPCGSAERMPESSIAPDAQRAAFHNADSPSEPLECTCEWYIEKTEKTSHFATFVSEIPRRAILAGTSAKGVCPKCGAPWVRQTNVSYTDGGPKHTGNAQALRWGPAPGDDDRATMPYKTKHSETIGWRPSCSCDAGDPIPGVVLDCFLGAGTTALVADQLGRHCIGIELAPSYAAMSERRVRDDAGMFAEIAAE